ncbi:MAG: hypothetical protein AAF585_05585 [Verrucomicrobiota bacterium]
MKIKANLILFAASISIAITAPLHAQISGGVQSPGLRLIEWGTDDEQVYWVDSRYLQQYSRGLVTAQSNNYIKTRAFLGSHGAEVNNGVRHVMCIFGPESDWFIPANAAPAPAPRPAPSFEPAPAPAPRERDEVVFANDYNLPLTAFEGTWWFHGTNTKITLGVEGNRISGVIPQHGARATGTIRREANGALKATLRFTARNGVTGSYVFTMDPFNAHAPNRFGSVQKWDQSGEEYRHEMRRAE